MSRCFRQVLTLRAAQFPDAFASQPSVTSEAYSNDPVFKLHGAQKGRVLQKAIWNSLAKSSPSTQLSKACPGSRVDGGRRAPHQAEFDFTRGGRRVECKGASMTWHAARHSWYVQWNRIKFNQAYFDDLFLAFHSPCQVDIILHNGLAGVSSWGSLTPALGHMVSFAAGRAIDNPAKARQQILAKMLRPSHLCKHFATLSSESLAELVAEEFARESSEITLSRYAGIPLADLSACARGLRLQEVALAVDQMLHPCSTFSRDDGSFGANADWLRDDVRVEFKSSRLSWSSREHSWRCQFRCIKFANSSPESRAGPAAFDELWLGLYSPRGLHFLQHGGRLGRSTAGVETELVGHSILVYGARGHECLDTALDSILGKLQRSGCKLLATIAW
ncbi:mad2l1-1 [Symbiodinium necroappetens]|uniref:Mad2l1-1 protein n=1 Tax=Symbiodinium necroappetens TaxID=1628268 RepID=A0A812QJI4_9DINO|nr:mad2l1-1 [Symbiodinium necroappetens]